MEKEDFRKISYEEELERAKWFKEDLEKGNYISESDTCTRTKSGKSVEQGV